MIRSLMRAVIHERIRNFGSPSKIFFNDIVKLHLVGNIIYTLHNIISTFPGGSSENWEIL